MIWNKTRGLRNKNPGNIRFNPNNDWKGQIGQDDKSFVIFSEYKYGIRAISRVLQSYQNRGVLTVAQIIETWAPATENDVDAYITSVEKYTGYPPWYIPQSFLNGNGGYVPLIGAIIRHENGVNPFSEKEILEAIRIE